jgi:endo-1,4-beta-xylanase
MTRHELSRRALLASGLALAAPTPGLAAPDIALRRQAADRGLVYGAAIEPDRVDHDPDFAALLRRQCGSLTPENAMKWNALRPARDRFDFTQADRVVALAHAQQALVHGHCLVWHEALPDWLPSDMDRRTASDLLAGHIDQVVGRYRGQVRSWDVANEVVERNDGRRDGLRLSPWFKAIGPSYLSLAFHAARATDPGARLVLSDYGLEYDDERWMVEKRGTMLDLLAGLKAAGVPIDALALQGHLIGARRPAFGDGLRRFLGQVADLGLEIHVTELDVDDQKVAGTPAQRDATVAGIYRAFLDVVLDEPAVKRITTWGLSDRYTSKTDMFPRADGQPVRPLPFDAALRPKAAALAIADALRAAPRA